MKHLVYIFAFVLGLFSVKAQRYSGEILIRDHSQYYLNQIFVTNINDFKTVKADYSGKFTIDAKPGDVIRFTSIMTDRKDITLTKEMLEKPNNFVELMVAYYDIEEVIVSKFKPSGNLRKDVLALKTNQQYVTLRKVIGLPQPKGDGLPTQLPIAGFNGGGLTFGLNSIYDLISGEQKKKERLQKYEKMETAIAQIKQFFGNQYFINLKIPENLTENFLQFVYTSDNLNYYIENNNFNAIATYIEKYVPIYQRRLKNSYILEVNQENKTPTLPSKS